MLAFVSACSLHVTSPSRAVGYGVKSSNENVDVGTLGQSFPPSKHRAVLHATIQALIRVQVWDRVYIHRLVIASSSSYLIDGLYARVGMGRKWIHRCKSHFKPDPHEKLWQSVMDNLEQCDKNGMEVRFWKIPEVCAFHCPRQVHWLTSR